MSGVAWLLWIASVWAAFLVFVATDMPTLLSRAANHLRQQHLPHWARHGHAQPDDKPAPQHHRHARGAR